MHCFLFIIILNEKKYIYIFHLKIISIITTIQFYMKLLLYFVYCCFMSCLTFLTLDKAQPLLRVFNYACLYLSIYDLMSSPFFFSAVLHLRAA